MTAQGLEYLQSLNLKEHNLEMEAQARRELRQQKRRDKEVKRHDKKQERLDFKRIKVESRKAKEAKRHDIRTEKISIRDLQARKWKNTQDVKLSQRNLLELIRHNLASEQTERTKAAASALNARTSASKYRSDVALKRTDQRIARRGQETQLFGTQYSADQSVRSAQLKADSSYYASKYKTDKERKSAKAKIDVDKAKNDIQAAFNAGRLTVDSYKMLLNAVSQTAGNVAGVVAKALPALLAG